MADEISAACARENPVLVSALDLPDVFHLPLRAIQQKMPAALTNDQPDAGPGISRTPPGLWILRQEPNATAT